MNEQLPISLPLQMEVTLSERAQRIRSLRDVARGCLIQIGWELKEARTQIHGEKAWEVWLDAEFSWSETVAYRLISVATVFSAVSTGTISENIDDPALYALAAPDVPQDARDEAIERAGDGQHVTKADAEVMIAEAMKAEQAKFAEVVSKLQAEAEDDTARAIKDATKKLAGDKKALKAEIVRIKTEAAAADIPTLVAKLCKATGRKRLKPAQFQNLACILGTSITDGQKVYPPASIEETQEAEERLLVSAPAMRALEYFLTAPDPDVVKSALRPFQSDTARRCVSSAIAWLNDLNTHLHEET